jgi:hypothetical protein
MSDGSPERRGPRSTGEIQSAFATMLDGPEELPGEDSSQEELPSNDSSDEAGHQLELKAGLADDSVVDEPDAVEPDESSESDAPLYAVTIDGNTSEVPLDELISGYQRRATYTKRNQELAQERESFEQQLQALDPERQALRQTYQQYNDVLGQLHQQMQAANAPPANLDWDALERENPVQWLKLKELERQRSGEIQAVRAEQVRMAQILEGENNKKLEDRLSVERTLVLEKIPEWSDSDLQADEQRKLLEFGKGVGFSDHELNNLYDHRALVVLRDAMRYNEITHGEKITAAKSKIGSVKGGNKGTSRRTRSREAKAMRATFKKTGKVDDAAALFGKILTE